MGVSNKPDILIGNFVNHSFQSSLDGSLSQIHVVVVVQGNRKLFYLRTQI